MDQIHIAQLLLNLGKGEKQLLGLLNFIYLNKSEEMQIYKLEDISNFTAITKDSIITGLTNLKNKNICGKIVYGKKDSERIIIKDFSNKFKKTVGSDVKEIAKEVGFCIMDSNTVYVYNTRILTWNFPNWKKIAKQVNSLNKKIDSELTSFLLENKKEPEVANCGDCVNGWIVKEALDAFLDKYNEFYGVLLNVNWQIDYKKFKDILTFLDKNNIAEDRLEDFIKFAFQRSKGKKFTVNFNNLKYSASDYVLQRKNFKDKGEYTFDVDGKLRKVTN